MINLKYRKPIITICLLLTIFFISTLFGNNKNIVPIYTNQIVIFIPGDNTLRSSKKRYLEDEFIVVDYTLKEPDKESWIGIFKTGDTKNSYNIIEDIGTEGIQKGRLIFFGLESGEYDIVLYGKTLEPKYQLAITHIIVEEL